MEPFSPLTFAPEAVIHWPSLALKSEEEPIPLLYPVDLLRKVAQAFIDCKEVDASDKHLLAQEIISRKNDELELNFPAYLAPFVIALQRAERGKLCILYETFNKEHPQLFGKVVWIEYTYAVDKRTPHMVKTGYQPLRDEIGRLQLELQKYAEEAMHKRLESEQPLGAADAWTLLQEKELALRFKELQLYIANALLRDFDKTLQTTAWDHASKTMGAALAVFGVICLAPSASLFVFSSASTAGAYAGQRVEMVSKTLLDQLWAVCVPTAEKPLSLETTELGRVATYQVDRVGLIGGRQHLHFKMDLKGVTQNYTLSLSNNHEALEEQLLLLKTALLKAIQIKKITPAQAWRILEKLSDPILNDKGQKLPVSFIPPEAKKQIFIPIYALQLLTKEKQ